jgi:hypothetical protein
MSDPGTQAPAPSAELRRFHAVARVVFKGAIALVGLNAVFGLLVVAGTCARSMVDELAALYRRHP